MKTPKMFLWEKNPDILDRRLNKLRSTYNVKSEMTSLTILQQSWRKCWGRAYVLLTTLYRRKLS